MQELAKARTRKRRLLAEVEAAAEKQRFEAEAEAEKERVLAEAEEAEILAKLRLESIKLKAEEELISCSDIAHPLHLNLEVRKLNLACLKSCD